MTDKILEQIVAELQAIRAALNARPQSPPSPAAQPPANAPQSTPGAPVVIPQPAVVIGQAADISVHFGKNQGRTLGSLSSQSLGWYASEKPAKTDASGKPYPPKPADTLLENAARTLWHQNHGTLAGPAQPLDIKSDLGDSETVPF